MHLHIKASADVEDEDPSRKACDEGQTKARGRLQPQIEKHVKSIIMSVT